MKYKTSDIDGEDLDQAVALALGWRRLGGYWWEPGTLEKDGGLELPDGSGSRCMRRVEMYGSDWAHGGPIIESEGIGIRKDKRIGIPSLTWYALMGHDNEWPHCADTPLIAAMRAFVHSRFGDEVSFDHEA